MRHPINLKTQGDDMKLVARAIADLRYDRLEEFLDALAVSLMEDSTKDYDAGRVKLATALAGASMATEEVAGGIHTAWKISEPHIKEPLMIVFSAPVPSEYEAFSNFEPCVIEMDGISYPTTEHAYQAYKSRNPTIRKHIAGLKTPAMAKKAARALPMRSDWEKVKFDIMVDCLRLKFAQEPFKALLLDTGDQEIVEDARQWDDTEWGIGKSGQGKNKLGKALMQVRAELRK